ncbi:hypothetical protein [Halobacillus sp. A5]|uniref:hypothetical protein n=1 Tax=Halobacillus sp. A5 TaxID=2880263 RepID=UPI0020A693AB|nr:hypothetical protein [Halobacillus sp. A5]MCP3027040.1 hypothetical protein [Halobacillus sp. A5]
MKTKLIYKLDNGKEIETHKVESEDYLFIPQRGDVLMYEGWGYQIGVREFSYMNDAIEITILGYRERKKRK